MQVNKHGGTDPEERIDDDFLEIWIDDTGIGIPPKKHKELFNDFYQIEGGLGGKTCGIGMGLSLAKRLVELHGGEIRVESQGQGKGSRFIFSILQTVQSAGVAFQDPFDSTTQGTL